VEIDIPRHLGSPQLHPYYDYICHVPATNCIIQVYSIVLVSRVFHATVFVSCTTADLQIEAKMVSIKENGNNDH